MLLLRVMNSFPLQELSGIHYESPITVVFPLAACADDWVLKIETRWSRSITPRTE